jgi:NitT/TauT family transport system substrate-binding protein
MKENAMLRTHRPIAAVALAGAVLATAACGGGSSSGSASSSDGASKELTELRIAATSVDSLPFMAILQVAADKGWCEAEGLDVSFISGSGGGNTLRTVSTGDADIAITGGPAVVLAQQQSPDALKLIGSWFQVNDFYFIGPEKVSPDGAKLGVTGAGSTTQLLAAYIKKSEMPGVEVVELGGGMGDAWAAARSGSIAAGWAMHPFVTDKVANEGAKVVITARDVIGDFPADLVAANATYAKENPDALKGFFRCAQKANEYIVNDTDSAAKDLSPILGIDAPLIADGLRDTPEMEKAYSLKVDPKALETLSDMLVSNGAIEKPVDWGKALDQSFLPDGARADF